MRLLDTSVVVDHLRGYELATALLKQWTRAERLVVASELTRFELLVGARLDEHDRLENFFSAIEWVPVTEAMTRRAGEYAQTYRRSHPGIAVVDYLLAGTASVLNAALVTVNVRHFPMFEGITPPYEYAAGPTP